MDTDEHIAIKKNLQKQDDIQLAIIYGSVADGNQNPESDLDLAVAGKHPLSSVFKIALIEDLSVLTGRPIDLVDLHTTNGVLLTHILTKGEPILIENNVLYGEIINRMLLKNADFMPYQNRILKERREQWINS